MKKYFVICAALLAAACSREVVTVTEDIIDQEVVEETQPVEEPAELVTYIEATRLETKASIDNSTGDFTWNTNDKIAVYAGGYKISDNLSDTYNGLASATFSFSGGEAFDDANRANFAVFPASLVYDSNSDLYTSDVTSSSLKVNLPASYTLAQVQGEVAPVPMIAANTPGGSLAFKNICALVRLTINNISKDAETLKITFPGRKVQGEFTLTGVTAGTTATVTADTAGADDTITITDLGISDFTSGLVISVPVPTGVVSTLEYGDVVVGAYDSAGNRIHYIYTPIKATSWVPGRTSARKVTVNLPVFTVSNDKKVVFAPGNLKAVLGAAFTAAAPSYASSWSFAAHQYDAIGDYIPAGKSYSDNSFRSSYVGEVFDLFAWFGTDATGFTGDYADDKYKYGIIRNASGIESYTGSLKDNTLLLDWGHNAIGDYATDTWRVLTANEWNKAVLTRSGATYLRATLTDGGNPIAYGLIITPDQYNHPANVTAFSNTNATGGACSDNEYTLAEWQKLESAGCVFLPLTNIRTKGTNLETINPGDGWYWTNDGLNSKKASAFVFNDINVGTSKYSVSANNIQYNKGIERYCGLAVRLVRDVN